MHPQFRTSQTQLTSSVESKKHLKDGRVMSYLRVRYHSPELNLLSDIIRAEVASKEKKEPLHVISRRTDGLPLFPIVHVGAETPDTLRKVLEGYFSYVWGELFHIIIFLINF